MELRHDMTHFKLVHIASHASHILALVYYIYLYFTPGEIDVESCLLRLSRHFLPELDGIAACQCLCRCQIPRLHTKQRVDLVTHGARYSGVRRACSCSHGQCNQSGRISVSAKISNSHSPSENVATPSPDTLAAKTST